MTVLPVDEAIRSKLERQDRVVLYPTFGHLSADGKRWHVGVSGVVFGPGRVSLRRRMLLRVLQRLMQVPASALHSKRFRDRISLFLVDTERGKQVAVRVGDQKQMLQRPSKRNGHFRGSLQLSSRELAAITSQPSPNHWVPVDVIHDREVTQQPMSGQAQLIGQTGLSVISDIDDTIKHSQVGDRQSLLRNTFLNPFEAIPGMPEVYRAWAERGAAFHYVSSSPWQLYQALQELMEVAGFPPGSFHLRNIRLRDPSILRLLFARRSGKGRVIRSIVKMFPHREFILVGDSGERDPETYGQVARAFPGQIRRILIRQVEGRSLSEDRIKKAFRQLSPDTWATFREPQELSQLAIC